MGAQVTETTARQVEELLAKWVTAEGASDAATIAECLDEDFVGIGPLGFTLTKAEWLQRHSSGDLTYDSFAIEDTSVRQYDDVAIVVGVQVGTANYRGNPVPGGRLRVTIITVHNGVKRVIGGMQMSPMGPPPVPPVAK
jgi:ketosteroid isomerase-like protein